MKQGLWFSPPWMNPKDNLLKKKKKKKGPMGVVEGCPCY
jgi:hypothetical protein